MIPKKNYTVKLPLVGGGRGEVTFPLDDGTFLLNPKSYAYCQDGLATWHNADFMREERFAKAYDSGVSASPGKTVHWRIHVGIWAASRALQIEGDFVECGVFTGDLSKAICEYFDFGAIADRQMYLLDTYEGMVEEQYIEEEINYLSATGRPTNAYPEDYFHSTRERFKCYSNVTLIKGKVPDTLQKVPSEKVAYLHIDMNCVIPEIAAGDFFWPKLSSGAFILLDDYGWGAHWPQKLAWDKFAKERSVMILSLPTGQGLIVKP
tara:strand:+ start:467 stop:1258 length:792 start_codon:yes stop_codon:yes gene_type:complete